jgi:hypothetical protein
MIFVASSAFRCQSALTISEIQFYFSRRSNSVALLLDKLASPSYKKLPTTHNEDKSSSDCARKRGSVPSQGKIDHTGIVSPCIPNLDFDPPPYLPPSLWLNLNMNQHDDRPSNS